MLSSQVSCALAKRKFEHISKVFDEQKHGSIVPKHKVEKMLSAFKLCDEDDIQHMLAESENLLAASEGLTLDACMQVVQTSSVLDQWSQSVPLWRLLSAAIPRKLGVSRILTVLMGAFLLPGCSGRSAEDCQ
jgi:hypothetical protein